MSLEFVKAGTADALTLNGISKRAFDSDVEVGAPSTGGPPGYMSVPFHTKMARAGNLYKLTDNGLIVGGALLFRDEEKLNIGRIFVAPEHFRKGYGEFMMRQIELMFPETDEFTLDTPVWNFRTNAFYTKLGYKEVKREEDFIFYSKKPDERDIELLETRIEKLNRINVKANYTSRDRYNKLYNSIYESLLIMESEGSIVLDPDEKNLGYLRELLINDGPEFSYTLVFRVKKSGRKYKIGVCVRGLPICKPL